MRNWRWIVGACLIGSAALGCAGETNATAMPFPSQIAGTGAGQGGAAAPSVAPAAGSGSIGMPAVTQDAGTPAPVPDAGAVRDAGMMPPVGADAGAPPAGEWTKLIEESWNLEPGGEAPQWCGDMMLTEDVYISAIRPIHPLGTHHTTLSVTPNMTACSSAALLQNGIIYAAGVGSEELRMPQGVAMKLSAGQVLHLGLHLYNVGDQPLQGVSGVEVIRVNREDVVHEAELMLSGPVRMSIPPGRQIITHNCTVTENQTVFAIFPHMHQLGVHMKTTALIGGQTKLVHDGAYAFEEQVQIPLDPFELRAGDVITTECTYENTGDRTVSFGESSDAEMCFSILYRFPATGNSFCGRASP